MKKNNVGILLPVFSLPGNHGIGDFSKYAYQFIKWLKKNGYRYWQILPLNPVGPGDSPYVTICSEAIDVRFISLDELVEKGLLEKVPNFQINSTSINYDDVLKFKEKYLRRAFKNAHVSLTSFKKNNPWVEEYAKYMVLKTINGSKPWNEWAIHFLPPFAEDEVNFHIWCQYIALNQWEKIKKFANKNDVQIIADCPFYVGLDSVDCFLNRDEFLLDENYNPRFVSGCPPDAFTDDGQLWGTPIYDFGKMKESNYRFLINRIACLAARADILRLDHFRAFDTYCSIPAGDTNARRGEWWAGPRTDFFDELYRQHPDIKLIAEDLGELFDSVIDLRDHYKLPGMRVYQFTVFDDLEDDPNCILYIGTHDNDTLIGRLKALSKHEKDFLRKKYHYPKDMYKAIMDDVWNMTSRLTIFQLQDLLKLDNRARINNPGTVGKPNWCFKFKDMSWMKNIKYKGQ